MRVREKPHYQVSFPLENLLFAWVATSGRKGDILMSAYVGVLFSTRPGLCRKRC